MTMTRYEIERELDSLYKDLNIAHNADEQTVCKVFNTDTKNEAIRAITEEIDNYEAIFDEMYPTKHVNYERTADKPYLCW